jgi:hypothetical protein
VPRCTAREKPHLPSLQKKKPKPNECLCVCVCV